MDGSFSSEVSGIGMILTSSKGVVVEYALWLNFQALNNKAEYEALIIGLKIANELRF